MMCEEVQSYPSSLKGALPEVQNPVQHKFKLLPGSFWKILSHKSIIIICMVRFKTTHAKLTHNYSSKQVFQNPSLSN